MSADGNRRRVGAYLGYLVALTLLFAGPLGRLLAYSASTDLHSHIVLVPFVAAYLLHTLHGRLPSQYRSSIVGAVVLAVVGLAAIFAARAWVTTVSANDYLALVTLAFVSLVAAGGFLFLGGRWMAVAAFPFAFLAFMVPMPDAVVGWLEHGSMLASADTAAVYFNIAGTSVVRHGTVFELPGIVLRVAQECSGIRSSWVLFITSLLASHLFLETRWRRFVLVAFVIPLGIVRNGFRILVIGLLCVHLGPQMIDSVIHRRGGPFFFALSLVPLFLLLSWLRRTERRAHATS